MSSESRWRLRVPSLPPQVPGSGRRVAPWIGRCVLALGRWSIEGEVPPLSKFVVIVAPHTSNWDFVVGISLKWALTIDAHWIGKHTLFKGPLGVLMRAFGGMPVNRNAPQGLVRRVAQIFVERDGFVLGIAPEGTRGGAQWKSGFWRIAREAGVPIVPVSIDYARRRCRIGPATEASPDYERDLAGFGDFYATVTGARPEHFVPPGPDA